MSTKRMKLSELRKVITRVHNDCGLNANDEETRVMARAMTPAEFYALHMMKCLEVDIEYRFLDLEENLKRASVNVPEEAMEIVMDIKNDHEAMSNWFRENPFLFDDDGEAEEPDYEVSFIIDIDEAPIRELPVVSLPWQTLEVQTLDKKLESTPMGAIFFRDYASAYIVKGTITPDQFNSITGQGWYVYVIKPDREHPTVPVEVCKELPFKEAKSELMWGMMFTDTSIVMFGNRCLRFTLDESLSILSSITDEIRDELCTIEAVFGDATNL